MRRCFASVVIGVLACNRDSGGSDDGGDGGTSPTSSQTTDGGAPSSTGPGPESGEADGTASGGTSSDPSTGTTSDPDSTSGTDTGVVESWPKACEDLYAQDLLPTFELTFSDAELDGLQSDCEQGVQAYRPVQFTYAGETVDAMVRLKGNWTWSCDKYQFVISFNEQDPAGRFHGLRKIVLDAPWYDRTLMHERLAFPLFEALGLPYSCVNNARLMLNGEYYGLYANVERIDQEYLERNFEESEGNLYQGGTELKTNELENDTANRDALFAASSVREVDALMDLDQAVAEWAAEAMLPAMDNYWAGVEINYYLYDHPSRGFVYLPYDLDISFGDSAYDDGSLIWPDSVSADPITYEHPGWLKEPLMQMVLADPFWCGRFVEELTTARAAFSPEAMAAQLVEWDAQIADAVAEDPNRGFSPAEHAAAVADLQVFLEERAAFVDAWLADGDHCPANW